MNNLKYLAKRVRRSRDARQVAINIGWLSIAQVASKLFPLITIPYLARTVGKFGIGEVAFACAVIVWIETIADWGFGYSAARDVSQNRENHERLNSIYSTVTWSRIMLTICSLFVLLLLIIFLPKFRVHALALSMTALALPGQVFYPGWLFQGLEKLKYPTILSISSRFLFTIAVFIFIHKPEDYWIQPLLSSIGSILSAVAALVIIRNSFHLRIEKPNFSAIRSSIKDSTDIFIKNLAPNLYNNLSVIVLGVFGGSVENGIYDAGKKCMNIAYSLLQMVSTAFFPFLSRRIDAHDFYAKVNIILAALISTILFAFSPLLIRIFYGQAFMDGVIVSRITSVALFFIILDSIYGQNYLIVQHYDKLARKITLIVSIVGMLISIPLIYYFSYIGAAISYTTASVLLGGMMMIVALSKKRKHEKA